MANTLTLEKNKKENTSEKVEGFMTKNRVLILVIAAVLVVAAVVVGLVFGLKDSSSKKAISEIDEIEYRLVNNSEELSEEDAVLRLEACAEDVKAYTSKGGNAGVRANMLYASVLTQLGNYSDAASSYVKAYSLSKKNYTAPLCAYNAAACYEESGDSESAAKYYEIASKDFDMAPHALISLGRVQESRGNTDAAVRAYQKVVDEYSTDNWSYIAQDRLIVLEK